MTTGDFRVDAISCPVQLAAPELAALADMDKDLGARTRERIMRELTADDLLGGPHFPGLRFGRVLLGDGRVYWS